MRGKDKRVGGRAAGAAELEEGDRDAEATATRSTIFEG